MYSTNTTTKATCLRHGKVSTVSKNCPPPSSIGENKQTVTNPVFNSFQTHPRGPCPNTIPISVSLRPRAVRGLNVSVQFTSLHNTLRGGGNISVLGGASNSELSWWLSCLPSFSLTLAFCQTFM